MKSKYKIILASVCAGFISLLAGCQKSVQTEDDSTALPNKGYDIFIYNSDTNIGTSFRKMCDEYTSRTGVIIRTVTPTDEENNFENLNNYLNSEYPPDIFTVDNLTDLKKLKDNSQIWDFSNATEDSFKQIVNNIPESLRLSSNTTDSFGIPYTIEGYGFLVDPKMISSLFGGEKHRKVLNDLKECSYEEFVGFVDALKEYIYNDTSYTFKLNDKDYSFVDTKGDLSKKLNGVFSFPAGNPKYSGTYLVNVALTSRFRSAASANIASDQEIGDVKKPLVRFAEALDLITLNIAGSSGILGRDSQLISNTQNSVSQSMKNFVSGKSIFLLANTHDYEELSIFDSLIAKRCVFIPIKIPMSSDEITSSEEISRNINKSITVYVPRYYCMNAKSSEKEKKAAQDFLTWLQTSDLAKKHVVSEFGFTPYDIEESSVIDNPLSRSMMEYVYSKRTLPGVFQGVPDRWCNESIGKYLIDNFLSKEQWSYEDYETIAEHGIKKWKEFNKK